MVVSAWDGLAYNSADKVMFRFDKKELKSLEASRFRHEISVRFQDVDAAGIVFFARVLDYMHDAYVSALSELGADLANVIRTRAFAAPLRHAEADYFSPLRFGDTVVVSIVAAHVEATEIVLGYQVTHKTGGNVTAVGQTVHTFVDPKTFQRIPVPDAIAEGFGALAPRIEG